MLQEKYAKLGSKTDKMELYSILFIMIMMNCASFLRKGDQNLYNCTCSKAIFSLWL